MTKFSIHKFINIVLVIVICISSVITAYWYGNNYSDYKMLKEATNGHVVSTVAEQHSNSEAINLLTPFMIGPSFVYLSYASQLIDTSVYLANLFALTTVLNNGGSEEDYNNGLEELNAKYSYYKDLELSERYNWFSKIIDLENAKNPVDLENLDVITNNIISENELKELSFYAHAQKIVFDSIFGLVVYNFIVFVYKVLKSKLRKKNVE